MWSISAVKTPGSPLVHATICSRKANEGTVFADVHSVLDFSGPKVTYTTAAPKDCVNHLESAIITAAKGRGSTPFSMSNIADSVPGRAADNRRAASALISRGILQPTGKQRGGGPLYLHADFMPASDAP